MKSALRFLRSLPAALLLGSLILWVLATFLWVRSWYRSDVVSISIGHRCVYIGSDNGVVDAGTFSPSQLREWSFTYSSSLPYNPGGMSDYEFAKLRGPNYRMLVEFISLNSPYHPDFSYRYYLWKRFSCGIGYDTEVYYMNESDSAFDGPFRGVDNLDPLSENREFDGSVQVRFCFVSFPMWATPVVLAIPPALWLLSVARRRFKRYSRIRRGYCTKCGYDLRGTPAMCPECGTPGKTAPNRTGEWRIASYGVFAVMIGFAVFLNRLNPVQGSKPSADDRRPAQVGMAIPWNPAAEHPDPLNAASANNGPYTVRVGFDHSLVVAVPRRNNFVWMVRSTDILRDGKVVYHWDAYLATTSLIDHDVLYREEEKVTADNDDVVGDCVVTKSIVAIDLRDGHQLWESGLTDAPHPHDVPGLCFEVRDGRLVIWADDANGRFAEVKDLQTGKTIGYCCYER